jgi:steroid 5-alpha reductase family enzyme
MEFIFYTLVVSYVSLFLYSLKIKDNSIVDVFWGFEKEKSVEEEESKNYY